MRSQKIAAQNGIRAKGHHKRKEPKANKNRQGGAEDDEYVDRIQHWVIVPPCSEERDERQHNHDRQPFLAQYESDEEENEEEQQRQKDINCNVCWDGSDQVAEARQAVKIHVGLRRKRYLSHPARKQFLHARRGCEKNSCKDSQQQIATDNGIP